MECFTLSCVMAFHIHTLSKGSGGEPKEKLTQRLLATPLQFVKRQKEDLWHFCCPFATVPLETILLYKDTVKLKYSSGTIGRAGTREEGVQLQSVYSHLHLEALQVQCLLYSPGLS